MTPAELRALGRELVEVTNRARERSLERDVRERNSASERDREQRNAKGARL